MPDRSAPTLMTAIEIYVKSGTLLITDCWRSYLILDVIEDFSHFTVNNHYNFVDPETGEHTHSIECLWREAKKQTNNNTELIDVYWTAIFASFWQEKSREGGLIPKKFGGDC